MVKVASSEKRYLMCNHDHGGLGVIHQIVIFTVRAKSKDACCGKCLVDLHQINARYSPQFQLFQQQIQIQK